MKSRSNILVCLTIIFGVCLPLKSEAWAADAKKFRSFLDYEPKVSEFPEVLRPLTTAIEAAGDLGPDKRVEGFDGAAAIGEALKPKINRAYEDQLWFLLGFAYEGGKHEKKALEAYEKSLRIRSNNLLALFRHANLLLQTKECTKAIVEFQEIEWQVKELAHEAKYLRGECLMIQGQTEEALKLFQQAYQKNPNYSPVLKRMIEARERQLGSTADPRQKAFIEAQLANDLGNLAKNEPENREVGLTLARLLLNVQDPLLESGKITQAEQIASTFAESSDFKDDASVRVLVQAQLKKGEIEEAEQSLARGLKSNPKSKELEEAKQQLEIEKQMKALTETEEES